MSARMVVSSCGLVALRKLVPEPFQPLGFFLVSVYTRLTPLFVNFVQPLLNSFPLSFQLAPVHTLVL